MKKNFLVGVFLVLIGLLCLDTAVTGLWTGEITSKTRHSHARTYHESKEPFSFYFEVLWDGGLGVVLFGLGALLIYGGPLKFSSSIVSIDFSKPGGPGSPSGQG